MHIILPSIHPEYVGFFFFPGHFMLIGYAVGSKEVGHVFFEGSSRPLAEQSVNES